MAVIFEPKKRYKVKFEGGPYDGTTTLTMSMKKPPKYWGCKTAAEAKGFKRGIYKSSGTVGSIIVLKYIEVGGDWK